MISVWKVFALAVFWFVLGCVVFWATVMAYSVKVYRLNYDDKDELYTEFLNLLTNNIVGFRKEDSHKDIRRVVERMTGESIVMGHVIMCLKWPHAMAILQPRMAEAYEFLKGKYGIKNIKSRKSAT